MSKLDLKPAMTLALAVNDRKAATQWYVGMLEFTLLYDVEEIGWCELETNIPGVRLGLADRQEIQPGGPVPTFEVSDLDSTRTELEQRGVEFEEGTITHSGLVRLAVFHDLDGHALMLAEALGSEPANGAER